MRFLWLFKVSLILLVLISCHNNGWAATLDDCIDATCMIKTTYSNTEGKVVHSGGTGATYEIKDNYAYVLTAGHVVNHTDALITAIFFNDGQMMQEVGCEVVKITHKEFDDAAILKISTAPFMKQRKTLSTIKLAPNKKEVKSQDIVYSVGCPNMQWPSVFKGHVTRISSGTGTISLLPNVISGRSGSPLLNKDLEIIGIIIQKDSDWNGTKCGLAISMQQLYQLKIFEP